LREPNCVLRKSCGSVFLVLGMGMTILDALDTLWIMGMEDEFDEGRAWLAKHLNFSSVVGDVSVFETTIRAVGGMLSAYDLSHDPTFLGKAKDLVDRCWTHVWLFVCRDVLPASLWLLVRIVRLMPAFETRSGIPKSKIDLQTRGTKWKGKVRLKFVLGVSKRCLLRLDSFARGFPFACVAPLPIRPDNLSCGVWYIPA
jgi:hypothetical protein